MTVFARFRFAPLLLAAALLSACALTGSRGSLTILAPQVDVAASPDWQAVDWTLQIQRPVADQMRDSDRVLVRSRSSVLKIYADTAWLDVVPELLQAAMVQTFTDVGVFAGVGRAGGIRTRFGMATEIRHFELLDDGVGGLRAEIVVQVTLLEQRTARPLAQRVFRQEVVAANSDIDSLVVAFEQALSGLLKSLVPWVLDEGRAVVSVE